MTGIDRAGRGTKPTEGADRRAALPLTGVRIIDSSPLQPAARLGEHGIDVLLAAGFDEPRIRQLLDSGALSFN